MPLRHCVPHLCVPHHRFDFVSARTSVSRTAMVLPYQMEHVGQRMDENENLLATESDRERESSFKNKFIGTLVAEPVTKS